MATSRYGLNEDNSMNARHEEFYPLAFPSTPIKVARGKALGLVYCLQSDSETSACAATTNELANCLATSMLRRGFRATIRCE